MVQKLAALLCLSWLFASPWWLKAMAREPNGMALLMALLALSWWGAHRWREQGVRPNALVRVLLWLTALFVGFQLYAVLLTNVDLLTPLLRATEPGSATRFVMMFVPGLVLGGLYAALLAYPMWALFGRGQLVLTLVVFGLLRLVQAPHHLFAAPRTLADTVAMTELMSAVLVMTLTVGALQWRLGHPPKRDAAP
ncbi:MAG: hypothetical protein A2711_06425 [Burkholderiales bacterium RIFCSPHIGHO2_01_FULL_63_240]|jgi:hypothetical protein|nr:MAG: hypothetical protein A2711_06425 [Burkholderiales bacterium RIFCSPHIGHO2_01_FULL_63_240]